jgi:hypothetical protein
MQKPLRSTPTHSAAPRLLQSFAPQSRPRGGNTCVSVIPTKANAGSVVVRVSAGEYLRFVVTDGGPGPSFTMAGSAGVIYSPPVASPQPSYEWFRFRNRSEPRGFDILILVFLFLSNAKYTYRCELWTPEGYKNTVFDLAYTGAPTDHFVEHLTVVTA